MIFNIKTKPTITLTTLILVFFLSSLKSYAGWYECYNFSGTINKIPITFSIQVKDGYFGEKDKKDLNLIGVYKYDHENEPILLEGKLNFKSSKALLYEMRNGKRAALFEFQFAKAQCDGVWKNLNDNKKLALHLNYINNLIDTTDTSEFHDVEILQSNSLKDLYFIGIYSKKDGESRAHMDKLKIINKKDNTVKQIIDFRNVASQTGNIWTIIYGNVQIANAKTNELEIWNSIGRMGGLLSVKFNFSTQKFKLNPIPKNNGPG